MKQESINDASVHRGGRLLKAGVFIALILCASTFILTVLLFLGVQGIVPLFLGVLAATLGMTLIVGIALNVAKQRQTAMPLTTGKPGKLAAFGGDRALKSACIGRVKEHIALGDMTNLEFRADYPATAVGFTIHDGDPAAFEKQLGIPIVLAEAENAIFQYLPGNQRTQFPLRFLKATVPGVDYSQTWWLFAQWLLHRTVSGILAEGTKQRALVDQVVSLYEHGTTNDNVWRETIEQLEQAVSEYAQRDDSAEVSQNRAMLGVRDSAILARKLAKKEDVSGLTTNVIVGCAAAMIGMVEFSKGNAQARVDAIYSAMAEHLLQAISLGC